MKKTIVLSLLLITCFSCDKEDNNPAGMGKASLLNRQWKAESMGWIIGDYGFIINTHQLNFSKDDTFRWEITSEVYDRETLKHDKNIYTGTYSVISDTGNRMIIEFFGEIEFFGKATTTHRATLDAERHLSIDNYDLIFTGSALY